MIHHNFVRNSKRQNRLIKLLHKLTKEKYAVRVREQEFIQHMIVYLVMEQENTKKIVGNVREQVTSCMNLLIMHS